MRTQRGLKSTTALSLLAVGGAALAPPSWAQEAEPNVSQLQREIGERDALIRNLVRRVENLERQMRAGAASAGAPATGGRSPAAPAQAGKPSAPPAQVAAAPSAPAAVPPPAPPAGTASQPSAPQTAGRAPGQLEVDVQAAERALERTLVATGALLVPSGFAEVDPAFSYTRREVSSLVIFNQNRNEYTGSLNVRLGLPWESQFELGVPYNGVGQQTTNDLVSPVQLVASRAGYSFGDVTVGFAKTLLHESGWLPDLVGRISYEAPTGPLSSNQVVLPASGQNRLGFSLIATKRQDPLVFVAGAGYTHSFEQYHIQQGDQLSFITGAFLATSPETTLRAVLQQNFFQDAKLNDVTIKGSNTDQSIMFFGVSSILGRNVLLDLQAGIGLTRDAPKYTVILSFPFRFGLPSL
jgi:hypothetical protein